MPLSPPRVATRPVLRSARAPTVKDLVQDAVHAPHFSATHIARLFLLVPWILTIFMPALQQLYILKPISFSSPVAIADTSLGSEVHLFTALLGIVTLVWSQMLEARRRQGVTACSEESQKSRWARTLGRCTTKDAKSMKMWTRFDCVEAACVCVGNVVGTLLSRIEYTLATRITWATAWVPITFASIYIVKRTVDTVVYTQGQTFPSWVTATASPLLFIALLFEIILLIMWMYASLYAPYPKPELEIALNIMLDTGDNYAVLCEDEAVFWASFLLPFEWNSGREPLDCDAPTCGYLSWQDLCDARRLAPLAMQTKDSIHYLLLAVPILLFLAISLIGSGRITRGQNGALNLAGLLVPHILLILVLGFCTVAIGIFFTATFFVHVPLLMSGQVPKDPRVCMPSSACGHLWTLGTYLGIAAFGLLPIDTIGRFLKQRTHRSRSYFLSYKQDDHNDGAVQMLHTLLPSSWLDKWADDRSEEGMVAGVTEHDVFIAFISPQYFSSKFCCLEMHTALSKGKPILVVFNQSKSRVQDALGWIPPELGMLKSNELLPIQEDIQMATTCMARIEAADIKTRNAAHSVPNLPKNSNWTTAEVQELQLLTPEEILGIRALLDRGGGYLAPGSEHASTVSPI